MHPVRTQDLFWARPATSDGHDIHHHRPALRRILKVARNGTICQDDPIKYRIFYVRNAYGSYESLKRLFGQNGRQLNKQLCWCWWIKPVKAMDSVCRSSLLLIASSAIYLACSVETGGWEYLEGDRAYWKFWGTRKITIRPKEAYWRCCERFWG